MAEPVKKAKLNRKILYWMVPVTVLPLVIYLFLSKGADLGQAQDDKKVQEQKKEEKAKLQTDRVENPSAVSQAEYKKAMDAAYAGRPPLPPEPTKVAGSPESKSEEIRRKNLEAAKTAIGATLPEKERQSTGLDDAAPGKKSFVVYTSVNPDGVLTTAVKGVQGATSEAVGTNESTDGKEPEQKPSGSTVIAKAKAAEPFLSEHNDKVTAEPVVTATRISGTHWISSGTIIRAVLLGAIDTTHTGQVTARTTEPVYDSRYGRYVVVPAGSQLTGQYDSKVVDGQVRVMMAFSSLITPSGGVINLNGMRASDALGRIGVEGDLHTRFWERMGVATLLALESVAMNRLSGNQTTVTTSGSSSTSSNVSEGAKIISDAANKELSMRVSQGAFITLNEGQLISVVTTGNIEIPPVANKR